VRHFANASPTYVEFATAHLLFPEELLQQLSDDEPLPDDP
jgi:hypothetical protein